MIAHLTQEAVDDIDLNAFPAGTKIEIESGVEIPYITLEQHELDRMTNDVPAMSAEGL